MGLWKSFEKGNCKLNNSKINVKFSKGIDKELKRYYLSFINYLRDKYIFPYPLNVYIKNEYKIKLMNGTEAYGKFHWWMEKQRQILPIS